MSDKTDTQVRSLILQVLYKKRRESTRDRSVNRETMIESLEVEKDVLDYHMEYLAEKKLISISIPTISIPPNSDWVSAEITAQGIDHVDSGK